MLQEFIIAGIITLFSFFDSMLISFFHQNSFEIKFLNFFCSHFTNYHIIFTIGLNIVKKRPTIYYLHINRKTIITPMKTLITISILSIKRNLLSFILLDLLPNTLFLWKLRDISIFLLLQHQHNIEMCIELLFLIFLKRSEHSKLHLEKKRVSLIYVCLHVVFLFYLKLTVGKISSELLLYPFHPFLLLLNFFFFVSVCYTWIVCTPSSRYERRYFAYILQTIQGEGIQHILLCIGE